MNSRKIAIEQGLPLALTFVILAVLAAIYYVEIRTLNLFTTEQIATKIFLADVLIGMTIYLKTSIDFAIFIGNLMKANPGWKNRVAIETGTAVGNALGTIVILLIWDFFKEITWLLAIMIIIASLVLFRLAKDGVEHAKAEESGTSDFFKYLVNQTEKFINALNRGVDPILNKIMPHVSMKTKRDLTWPSLLMYSFTVPFILGLDDFAGYVPLFNIINVFGFGLGVMLGHTLLNILLFISPNKTITAVKNPIIAWLGSIAFVGLGIWGLWEVGHILIETYGH
jgi:hypothetical protein